MPQAEQFEALVGGSGQGGKLLARHLAQSGRRTDDFRSMRNNLVGGRRSISDRLVHCVFIDAPLAGVGSKEREAQWDGIAVRVARLPTSAAMRTDATSETKNLRAR